MSTPFPPHNQQPFQQQPAGGYNQQPRYPQGAPQGYGNAMPGPAPSPYGGGPMGPAGPVEPAASRLAISQATRPTRTVPT